MSRPKKSEHALDRAARLAKKLDFERVFREGGRARGKILLVVAAKNEVGLPRVGLSVGRAIWKSAVKRNRIRRIFRESFRLSQKELPAGFDLVLVPASPKLVPELEATRLELIQLARLAATRKPRPRGPDPRARPAAQGTAGETRP